MCQQLAYYTNLIQIWYPELKVRWVCATNESLQPQVLSSRISFYMLPDINQITVSAQAPLVWEYALNDVNS